MISSSAVLVVAAVIALIVVVVAVVLLVLRARRRAGQAAALPSAPTGAPGGYVCPFCKRPFEPEQTGGRCPSCGAAAPRH
ncbi:MAG TPA: hypothetical protein VOB72_24680 [Candidatus Dormibacteraeota bacterium]|nr:hypothetical protein [Candidatus Dormibacteraeota bacterium]